MSNGREFFGTDGIRGKANTHPMTAEVALKLGMAAGSYFTKGKHRNRVVIGKDTRLSGYMFEPALTAGFVSVGMDVILVGPLPTPAISMLTHSLRADLGVMISASHNTFTDNGIKLFGPTGHKLSDEVEIAIEKRLLSDQTTSLISSEELGRAKRLDDAPGRYIECVKSTFPKGRRLDGLKIVIDCANGAAYHLGATILWELGADVIELGNKPNGFNINENCGSTNPETMCQAVISHNADLGIALDGDADRVIIADENGTIIDGDQLMALIATHWKDINRLKNGVVTTVMSNLGLEQYLNSQDIPVIRTPVGDRYVAESMYQKDYNLGGEQSGHIILSDYSKTGDGLIAALQVLAVIVEKKQPASEVCNLFTPLPQILHNVECVTMPDLEDPTIQSYYEFAESTLGKQGRLLIRKSGTEPLIRVMAEGEDILKVQKVVDHISKEIHATYNS